MKKIRGNKPINVIVHIYMEMPQGNSLCSYLYLKQAKMSFFFLLFFFLQQTQRIGGGNRSFPVGRVSTSGRGDVEEKVGRMVNTVQKMCAHVSKCKKQYC
jgi:hypothetical protein